MSADGRVRLVAASFLTDTGVADGIIRSGADGVRLEAGPRPAGCARLSGLVTGGFTDHHVHLQLVDASRLTRSRLGRVVDLGADPVGIQALANRIGRRIGYAGAFLTAWGGYPSDRSWAPTGSFREIVDVADAMAAVSEMADAGASCIKVASNRSAGPVLADDLFAAVVQIAHSRELPVVVHAEGAGEAMRAARLGADRLAHAPFSGRLTGAEIAAQDTSVEWVSTLAIHSGTTYDDAIENLRRFHAAGGIVRYGNDMGNGDIPVDLDPREIAALRRAGVDGDDLLRALVTEDPLDPESTLLHLPQGDPARARPLTTDLLGDPT